MSINVDEWGSRGSERLEEESGRAERAQRSLRRVPLGVRVAVAIVVIGLVPIAVHSTYIVQVGINALLMALLAMGLNVVAGWAGLLDLGYVAFYGFGAYVYALLSSNQVGIHLPGLATILIALVAAAGLGTLVGLPSIRLVGDYLAIVTLFFGQAFVQFVTNVDRGVTGGPGGITGVQPLRLLGLHFTSVQDYYYLLLGVVVVVAGLLHNLNRARLGRAWRALREDPVAAEVMGVPVSRVKLLAFGVGAAIAGLTGTVFAAVEYGAYPTSFGPDYLIMVYAVVVLGGTGKLSGVLVAAGVIIAVPEVLRSPEVSTYLFYILVAAAIVGWLRPWRRMLGVLGGAVAVGFVVRAVVGAAAASAIANLGALGAFGRLWMVDLARPGVVADVAFIVLVASVLAVPRLRGLARTLGEAGLVYLAAFVWENLLVLQPSVTRQLFLGALLIVAMNLRPQGLLGEARVEVV
ncbi:MAG: branched-chain amino acid ABC transporter permease [Acidimicrobiales bacterium]